MWGRARSRSNLHCARWGPKARARRLGQSPISNPSPHPHSLHPPPRGMYRTPGSAWLQPAELVPPGSSRDDTSGAMRSPLAHDKRRDVWEQTFKVRRRMAPVQLAFSIYLPGAF